MRGVRRGALVALVAVVVVLGGATTAWYLTHTLLRREPGCTITGPASSSGAARAADLAPAQADNAATIAAVGIRLGIPDHAVTVALATAMQESRLTNLTGGDRDSAGLFQQRPSQGWGTYAQVTDPVHAATAFYDRLRAIPNWPQLSVTEVAQLVQHSAEPDAYAQWEPEARTIAAALTGEAPAALSCHDLTITASATDLAAAAVTELGTAVLTGHHDATRGWAISSWLVAHAARFGIDQVIFDGHTWTASTGAWAQTGTADGKLTLHRVSSGGAPTNQG
jgi:hypothetical protein